MRKKGQSGVPMKTYTIQNFDQSKASGHLDTYFAHKKSHSPHLDDEEIMMATGQLSIVKNDIKTQQEGQNQKSHNSGEKHEIVLPPLKLNRR